jgi:hypothetical protein
MLFGRFRPADVVSSLSPGGEATMRVYSPDHAPDVMVRDFYGPGSPLLIDVTSLAAEGDVAAARVARTPQGAHLRKHEHSVRDPHQYNSLQN